MAERDPNYHWLLRPSSTYDLLDNWNRYVLMLDHDRQITGPGRRPDMAQCVFDYNDEDDTVTITVPPQAFPGGSEAPQYPWSEYIGFPPTPREQKGMGNYVSGLFDQPASAGPPQPVLQPQAPWEAQQAAPPQQQGLGQQEGPEIGLWFERTRGEVNRGQSTGATWHPESGWHHW